MILDADVNKMINTNPLQRFYVFRHLRVISDVAVELKYKPFFDYLSNRGLLIKILKICKNIDH